MARQRSIIASFLALLMVFLVNFSSSALAAKASTKYTDLQVLQIKKATVSLVEARDRLSKLEKLIDNRKWVDVATFIHGPLGFVRQDMSTIARNISSKEQAKLSELTKEVSQHLVQIDVAAKKGLSDVAYSNYRGAVQDLDVFLSSIPSI
jgi:photosystem II protein PsbQ